MTDQLLSIDLQKEIDRQMEVFTRGVQENIPLEGLKYKITNSVQNSRPLKIKLGLDPSAPDVHLGHTVVLNKLRQFQENGHVIQLIIGDFTGRIGDPTGKSESRKQLSDDEVKHNAKTYFEQFGKVLDMSKVELHYNSKWLSKLTFEDVINLAGKITVARIMERDDFEGRMAEHKPISLHEFFYPIMQGYDSVMLSCDIELGGTDQHFNILMGRHFQEKFEQEKQVALLMPLLVGLDGVEKMSKSKRNYIGISEEPKEMYGKAMSIPDELMINYYELISDLPREEIDRIKIALANGMLHPRDVKMKLASTIVRMYHGEKAAEQAQHHFVSVFQQRDLPEDIPVVKWSGQIELSIVELLTKLELQASNGEARRMVQGGGVKIDNEKITDIQYRVNIRDEMIIQVGRRKFVRIKM